MKRMRKRRKGWRPPVLMVPQILAWADAFHASKGRWPRSPADRDPIPGTHGETWGAVQNALQKGHRGLPGGSSIARLLAAHRGVRNIKALPPFTEAQILAWADAFRARAGRWPNQHDWYEAIPEAPGETWLHVEQALQKGARGLPGGNSLARLLAARRGLRNAARLPPLTEKQIVGWAKLYHKRERRWPTCWSPGPIQNGPITETWFNVNQALRKGLRGLKGGSSLARLLSVHRGVPVKRGRVPGSSRPASRR